MALGIPLPSADFGGGLARNSQNLLNQLMQKGIKEEDRAQAERHFQEQLKLQKAAAARAGANSDLNRAILQQQLLRLQHSNDPMYEFNQFKNLMGMMGGGGQGASTGGGQLPMPNQEVGEGMGAFSPEGLEAAKSMPTPQNTPQSGGLDMEMIKNNPLLRGYFKSKFGFDPFAESPEQKRALEFQQKVDLENLKTENKAKALKDKELVAVQKDMPTLEKSLKGVDELLQIAKMNPDLFGHGFMPERFAKTTKNKAFGRWQNLIADAIAGLEQKLSARGNIVALKMAAQLKPSQSDQQDVAIGKLESMRQNLIDSINNSRSKLGQEQLGGQTSNPQYNDNDLVVVEGPNGRETMTYAQAKALGAQ